MCQWKVTKWQASVFSFLISCKTLYVTQTGHDKEDGHFSGLGNQILLI